MISSGTQLSSFEPHLAIDGFGSVYAVWSQSDDATKSRIWSNHLPAGRDWGDPVQIDDDASNAGGAKIVAGFSNSAYAVWEESETPSGTNSMRWNRYLPGTGWSTPGRIAPTDTRSGYNLQLGYDLNGSPLVVWERDDGVHIDLGFSRLLPGKSEWDSPIGAGNTDSVARPALAVSPEGDVVAAWQQTIGDGVGVLANRFQ